MDISTTYLGLNLKSPLIVGSSTLTENINNSLAYQEAGAGAIVLKSLFEEQILHDVDNQRLNNMYGSFSDQEYYAMYYSKKHNLTNYVNLIKKNKEALDIPVIASINCVSAEGWISYAKMIEEAGADALEVNLFLLPADIDETGDQKEAIYLDIVRQIGETVNIPFALKISYYFSGLANFIKQLSETKASGLVLFNKFYSPNVDIEKEIIVPGDVHSCKELNVMTVRWIGILYEKVKTDFAASRGIYDGETLVKNLLVGAKVAQIVSAVYKGGPGVITEMLDTLKDWMERHSYNSIAEFRGKASQHNVKQPVLFERTQFMKYFSDAGY